MKYQQIYDFILEYSNFFEECISVHERLIEIVSKEDLIHLDKIIKEEEVLTLKSKQFERARMNILAEHDLKDKSFKEIIKLLEGEDKTEFEKLYDNFLNTIEAYQEVNKACNELVQTKIHIINAFLEKPENKSTYSKEGVKRTTSNQYLSKKI